MTDRDSARAAKDGLRSELAPLGGVGGIGIGRRDGSYVVTVDVVDESDGAQVPSTWDGVDVEVRVVGAVYPLPAPPLPTAAGSAGRAAGRTARRAAAGPVGTGPGSASPVTTGRAAGAAARWRRADPDGRGTGR